MNSEQLRKEFESWVDDLDYDIELNTPDNDESTYKNKMTDAMWGAYCAAYVAAATKRDKLIEELLSDLEDAHQKYPPRSLRKAELMGYGA